LRDRDVRNSVVVALQATGAFDPGAVWLFAPSDQGEGTSATAAAWVEPISSSETDLSDSQPDGGIDVTSEIRLTFAFRADDPQKRDEGVENLLEFAQNALNAQSLAGLTMPAWTRIASWRWVEPTPPERQIVAMFSYRYVVEGWTDFDTSE
jgi:hypothetical protein